jgi:uncharacterized protein YkwD
MNEKLFLLLFMVICLGFYYEYTEGIVSNFLKENLYESSVVKIEPFQNEIDYPEPVLSELEAEIQILVNEVRMNYSLKPVVWNDDLAGVARLHSNDMANRSFFSHINPDGLDSKNRIEESGIFYFNKTGENLYWLVTRVNQSIIAQKAVDGWLGSPGHRDVMLDIDFNEAGVGVAVINKTNYYITHNFITRVDCGYKFGPCCPSPPGYLPSCYIPHECVSGICQ